MQLKSAKSLLIDLLLKGLSMSNHRSVRTFAALTKMIEDMQYLVDHPRMQQRNWVAKGREWLPILQDAKEELQENVQQNNSVSEPHQSVVFALVALGLSVEKRDATIWAYRWHNGSLEGAFSTQAAAIEAGLRSRLR